MSDSRAERAPLLGMARHHDTPPDSFRRAFFLATAASLVAGALTIVLLITTMIIMSNRPRDYYPPYEVYYSFAPIAGCSIIALVHSGTTFLRLRGGDSPPRGLAGILVDVFAGLYFLFQSLYGMQQFLYSGSYGCHAPWYGDPNRPVDPDCDVWRSRAEPVVWSRTLPPVILKSLTGRHTRCYFFFALLCGKGQTASSVCDLLDNKMTT
ncbi:hypothetical protein GE09DRAFT_1283938 [Coniochaeta sp. 2T2.1]|nr:hypothetical protein GE09DRAFT_1283938 [Coniochaeta sp. 2T2.1]